jgi:hypothetical protein
LRTTAGNHNRDPAEADKTLPGVAALLSDPARTFEQTLRLMMTTPHLGAQPHPVVAGGAQVGKVRVSGTVVGAGASALFFAF